MELTIDKQLSIEKIQRAFNMQYPYLKLMFSLKPELSKGLTESININYSKKPIEKHKQIKHNQSLVVNPEMTVKSLEHEFHSLFGLSIQIYRKSGTVWLETTLSDSWTLEEQNKQGEILSKRINM
jgi:hypothetical protein